MLNLAVGVHTTLQGRNCILTKQGLSGHAVFGPYQHLSPGFYVVEFNLTAAERREFNDHLVCARLDVASDYGGSIWARQDVTLSQVSGIPAPIRLVFQVERPQAFEFRVFVSGIAPLLIDNYCRLLRIEDPQANYAALLDASSFPDPHLTPGPAFFLENQPILRRLYEKGAIVRVVDGDVIVSIDGISFYAREIDDLRFVDEIFFRNTYNFMFERDCCVIDIGMNLGLVAMTFAKKASVKEVHAFEPFHGTFLRARANLGLNPDIAAKISANNIGLSDSDEEKTILIRNTDDSGAYSIAGSATGTPEPISVRSAAAVLKPIIAAARGRGLEIIAKVDCEGAEFPIFENLEAHGLLSEISAFMVEWHRGSSKTQDDLIAPLLRHGYVAFDLSGASGNGFFYAVKHAPDR